MHMQPFQAVDVAPEDARPPLNLGRYLAKLSRPAEAIEQFYAAAVTDAEYFDEVQLETPQLGTY